MHWSYHTHALKKVDLRLTDLKVLVLLEIPDTETLLVARIFYQHFNNAFLPGWSNVGKLHSDYRSVPGFSPSPGTLNQCGS